MRTLALTAILAYQRFISPYKGFCCAYKHHTGRRSCSSLGYRAIRMHGVLSGIAILNQRIHRCGVAHRRYRPLQKYNLHAQRGVCDISCDIPCDLPWHASDVCDAASCCDIGSCDLRSRRRQSVEKYVYIAPKVSRRDEPRHPR
jgi:putative component of membrane protein insertase Oxa1/YidC/SpoIIIJ protein YidD